MEEPPCHVLSPEHPAGSRMMICQQTLSLCAGWLLGLGPIGPEPPELPGLVSSQELSLHPPFDPVPQEVFLNELREADYSHPSRPRSKIFSSKKPSMIPPSSFSSLQDLVQLSLHSGRPPLTTLKTWPPSPKYLSITLYNCFQDSLQSEFRLIMYVYQFIFHPPHRSCVLHQDSNLTHSIGALLSEVSAMPETVQVINWSSTIQ